ncbi:MAG: winged helix-turn-helix transcriptional regulator [Candidatus Doudnabacteria bacterium]|nr:winged helix-turn-helix transcriptional regulator [Candidatus Doudnabacteria bacterium]
MVNTVQTTKYPLTQGLVKKARLLDIAGDQTRIRILCFMFDNNQACVSEIAEAVGASIGSVSHHLQLMRDNGLFSTVRDGNNICYILTQNDFTKQLKKIICQK